MLTLIFFCISLAYARPYTPAKYIAKYNPEESNDGMRVTRKYPQHTMEVTLSFGATEEMVRVAETAIEDNYSGISRNMGEEVNEIGNIMEYYYGGAWSVAFFEDPGMFAYTIQKRAASFMVFDVDGAGISVSREGGTKK